MSDEPVVLTETRGHTLIITLNRPKARNAVNGDVANAVEAAMDRLEEDDDLWIGVITGNGKVFCAGADLKVVSSGAGNIMTQRGDFAGFVRRERRKPVIAALNGDALAGGCEIAIACDLIVGAAGARMGLPEAKRSLLAAAGGLVRLPRLIGEKMAMEIALTADPFTVERMYDLGLVNRVVPLDDVLDTALELADKINANAPLAVRGSRSVVTGTRFLNEEEAWAFTLKEMAPIFGSEDFQEGPRSFIEKRPPKWKGK